MSAPAARLPLPRLLQGVRASRRPLRLDRAAVLRLAAFAALAAYVTAAWLAMLVRPPVARAVWMLLAVAAGAAALAWLGGRRWRRSATVALSAGVVLASTALAMLAVGLPARLLLPWHWGELGTGLAGGWGVLWNVDYPYDGTLEWTRLVLLLALPLTLSLAATLAFWPARRRRALPRGLALGVLVAVYATATTVSAPSAPLLDGMVLLLLIGAWLWLPRARGREAVAAGGLVLAAGLLALPVAGSLAGHGPLVDYRSWGSSSPSAGAAESFIWDQSYGPLTWPRVGRTLFEVKSNGPYYWRTAVLDDFDGASWVQSEDPGSGGPALPVGPSGAPVGRLDPAWVHQLTFTVRGLRSDLVVGAGTPLRLPTLAGVTPMDRGLVLPTSEPLSDGETYTMRSYIPDPSPAQMRRASTRYPAELDRDTALTLPSGRRVQVPFWGAPSGSAADRELAHSAYGGVYRLARRVTARARTPYDAVSAVETYLGAHYRYSEFAPIRHLALRTFLLRARHGYCQHFSGAMALMLRMVGIPARVAAGFSPGEQGPDGTYAVTDFDAHSWVEAYFDGIGWVTFDPTPAGAPARSRVSGLGASGAAPSKSGTGSQGSAAESGLHRGSVDNPTPGAAAPRSTTGGGPPVPALVVLGLLALAGIGVALARVRRRPPAGSRDLADAQLHEVASALERVRSWRTRGATLMALERRLAAEVGPGAAAYLARIRAARFAPGEHAPPETALRAVLRRELASGLGFRGRLLSLASIPPAVLPSAACKRPFRRSA